MASERVDEVLLTKYLLGNLSETEQVEVEDRAFADADYMNALEASEADLIDSYVRGGLSQSDRRAFERRFLTSANRRRKVEFARALARVAAESREIETLAPRQSLLSLLRAWTPPLRAAAVVALFCIVGSGWLIFQHAAMRSQIGILENQRREFESRERVLQQQVASEQQSRVTTAPKPQTTATPTVASLVLLPGLSRARTQVEQLVLTPSTQIAHIDIQLEDRDNYTRYRAELRTRRGEDVLTRANLLRHRTSAGGYAVSFDIPSSALAAGGYELALKGVAEGRTVVDISYHYFGVRKQ
jgi:anti-sigma factor RsiW